MSEQDFMKKQIKFIDNRIKEKQSKLKDTEKDISEYGCFDDCWDFFRENVVRIEGEISALIELKISFEKYLKKIKYESMEENVNE